MYKIFRFEYDTKTLFNIYGVQNNHPKTKLFSKYSIKFHVNSVISHINFTKHKSSLTFPKYPHEIYYPNVAKKDRKAASAKSAGNNNE